MNHLFLLNKNIIPTINTKIITAIIGCSTGFEYSLNKFNRFIFNLAVLEKDNNYKFEITNYNYQGISNSDIRNTSFPNTKKILKDKSLNICTKIFCVFVCVLHKLKITYGIFLKKSFKKTTSILLRNIGSFFVLHKKTKNSIFSFGFCVFFSQKYNTIGTIKYPYSIYYKGGLLI